METTTNYFSTLDSGHTEETSMIGPPASQADQSGQVGLPDHTPEEQERINKELLTKTELGLYKDKELLEADGRKILVENGNPNLGKDTETGMILAKSSSGAWLAPTDKDYEQVLSSAIQGGGSAEQDNGKQRSAPGHSGAWITSADDDHEQIAKTVARSNGSAAQDNGRAEEQTERRELEQNIKTMVAMDEGSAKPHKMIDEAALQRLRAGASTMELKTIKPIVATVDGFAISGVADVNPETIGHMHPKAVSGPGVEKAMLMAQEQKRLKNEQFAAEQMRRKEKEKKS